MGKKSGPGSGMSNPDHIFESLETIFLVKILKFFDADPGWKKFGSGIRINIPRPQLLQDKLLVLSDVSDPDLDAFKQYLDLMPTRT